MTFSGTGLPVSLESNPADIYIYTTSKLQFKKKKKIYIYIYIDEVYPKPSSSSYHQNGIQPHDQ